MKAYQIVGRTHPNQPMEYVRFQYKEKRQAEEAMQRIKNEWEIREVDIPEHSAIFDPMPEYNPGGVQ